MKTKIVEWCSWLVVCCCMFLYLLTGRDENLEMVGCLLSVFILVVYFYIYQPFILMIVCLYLFHSFILYSREIFENVVEVLKEEDDGELDNEDCEYLRMEGRVFVDPNLYNNKTQIEEEEEEETRNEKKDDNKKEGELVKPDFVPASKMYNIWIDLADAPKPEKRKSEEKDEKLLSLRRKKLLHPRFVYPPFPEQLPHLSKPLISSSLLLRLSYGHPQIPYFPSSLALSLSFTSSIRLSTQV